MENDPDRLALHSLLQTLFSELKLYFRPPSKIILEYPCIVYDVKDRTAAFSNNDSYILGTQFQVTFMSNLPGLGSLKSIFSIPHTSFVTSYTVDDIVHEIFQVTIKAI